MFKKTVLFTVSVLMCLILTMNSALAVERYEVLMKGDKDNWVTELQEELYKRGYLKQNPTGYYGTNTQDAVIQFQKDNGLAVDGKAGPETRKSLLGSNYTTISSDRLTTGEKTEAEVYYPGDRADYIKVIQQKLKDLEYYTYSNITGYFGPITEDAVRRFQSVNNLTVDGIVGKETLSMLESGNAKYFVLYPGDKGDLVVELQKRLKELNYFSGNATGYFGNVTEAALKAFQKANNLTADGKLGKNTRAVLYGSSAIAATGTSDSDSSGDDTTTTTTQTKVEKMIAFAKEQLGKPYKYSTEGPSSFDCSGLIYYVLREMGVKVSRLSALGYSNLSSFSKVTKMSSLQPGDLVFFRSSSSSNVNHTGIYIGSNKMIHASSSNKQVVIGDISSSYYQTYFVCGRRVF